MIFELIKKATSQVAKLSAHRPIHTIVITTLLASIAYLSVVDVYVTDKFQHKNKNQVSFYHPPGSSAYQQWTKIDDYSEFNSENNADHFAIIPLKFKRINNNDIPEIQDSFFGVDSSERLLIINYNETDETLQSLDKVSNGHGITWKARHAHRITKYYEYAKSAISKLIVSFRNAENFDIALITVAYIAMWYTLAKVFIDMRSKGSNFWLAFSTILSSTFGFLFALVTTTKVFDCKVPLISLTEGLPFLVAIIGFRHKVSLASSIMKSPTLKIQSDVKTIVSNAVYEHTGGLLKDHAIVIGAFIACSFYAPHLEGLRNFCVLSSLILAFDLILVYTFYSAILALKVEINMIRRVENLRDVLEEDGISESVANSVANSSNENSDKNLVFGKSAHDSSILTFKIVSMACLLGFHIFWFGSSWLYDLSYTRASSSNSITALSKAAAKHISVGENGTIVTILPQRVYMPLEFLVQLEDFILDVLEKISTAIKDSIISKFLLFAFAISISTNVYFLNATRFQNKATNKLLESETSKPFTSNVNSTAIPISSHSNKKSKHKTSPVDSLPSPPIEDVKETEISSETEVTEETEFSSDESLEITGPIKVLPLEDCVRIMKEGRVKDLNNKEVATLVTAGKLPLYALEKQLGDNTRAVLVRRKAIAKLADAPVLDTLRLPYAGYDYDRVFGACCENVIGYMPIPVGVAGPLIIDGKPYHIPMATTEGCLVASTMRGCKAINAGGGVTTVLTQDGMTRGPCVSFPTLKRAGAAKIWLDSEDGQKIIKKAFNSTSRFARLQHIQTALAGTLLFIRFRTTTGDAMGMNMISKGVEHSLKFMVEECGWNDMSVISVSGNYCTDKKPAAINWIEGRGKSVVAEARIPADVVKKVLKSEVDALVELNIDKNLVGSAMAGSVGGFNAHAANLVTAVFLATGQDPAQNVESSNCITLMKNVGGDLQISVSMPSIEVGTIGGGTILEPQSAMLDLLGVRGPHPTNPGDNARQLARVVASAVLAAELSLCSALAAGHLVQSHMQHNRKGAASTTPSAPSTADVKRLTEGSNICIRS